MRDGIKTGLSILFTLFTFRIVAFVHDFSVVISQIVMLVSLLIVLYFVWDNSTKPAIAGLTVLAIQFILPLFLNSSMLGFDSWFYVRTAQAFAAGGWQATPEISLNASLFPGVQLFIIVLSGVTGCSITKAAHLYPVIIKAAVPVLVIGAYTRWTSKGAALAALVLTSYSEFLIGFPFHHLTHGILLLLLAIPLLWRWIETSRQRDFLMLFVAFIALLITHQSSTVHWGLLAAVAVVVAFLAKQIEVASLKSGFTIIFTAAVEVFAYYLWVAPEYFILALNFQKFFIYEVPQVHSVVQKQLVGLPRNAWLTSDGLGIEGEKNAAAVVFFLTAAFVGLFALRHHVTEEGLFSRPWIELTAFTSLGMLALVRLTAVVGFSHLGGTSRILVVAFPIGFIGMAVTIHRTEPLPLQQGVMTIVVVLLLINIVVLPSYFFMSEPTEVEEQPLYMTPQWQAGYDWLGYGENAVVGTQGNIYLSAMTHTEPVSSYRPYAGDLSQTDAELIHFRDDYRSHLLIRSLPWSYRVPEQQVRNYNQRWRRVYVNGDSTVFYQRSTTETSVSLSESITSGNLMSTRAVQ